MAHLTCPSCRHRFAAPEGAGDVLPCPRCRAPVPCPTTAIRADVPPSPSGIQADPPRQRPSATVACPHCGKWIAEVCLFCPYCERPIRPGAKQGVARVFQDIVAAVSLALLVLFAFALFLTVVCSQLR